MNKKGLSEKELLDILKVVAFIILIYIMYRAVVAQFGRLG